MRLTVFAGAILATVTIAAPARAAQTVDVSVSQVTGTASFDPSPGPGNDTGPTDAIVRSNDTVTYQIQFNVNDSSAGSSVAHNLTIHQALPAGLRWTRLPATCLTSGVTPASSISPDGSSITCNVGDTQTGVSHTIALSANVTEMANGTVLTPGPDSIDVGADGATGASTTPAPVTVSSIPRVDMVKSPPTVTETTYAGEPGYFLRYPVRVQIPNFGGRGLVGYEPPAAAMSLEENFAAVSAHAVFVSCGPDGGGTWSCPAAGTPSPAAIDVVVANPNSTTSGTLSSTTVTIFVPRSDITDAGGAVQTENRVQELTATDADGVPAVGENPVNNVARATLTLNPGSGFGVFKHYVDVTASGRFIPGGANVDRNGFSTVSAGQIFQGEVRVSASNPAAGYSDVAACDVFDTTTQQVTLAGAATNPGHGNGRPAWVTTNSAGLVQGTDFVIEYSTDPTSADPGDATRWAALRGTDCAGGTWSATPPADAGTVTRVRLRFLVAPPRVYTLAFAVNLAAKPGSDGTTIANFATYDVGAGWVHPTYDPSNHGGGLGDRVILSTAQITLAKDILDPATTPTGTPAVRGGEEVEFGLRPRVAAPSQATTPQVVSARDVTVTDVLPAGTTLSTITGHEPSPSPTSVVANPDGSTTIVWDLGTQTSDDTPQITYWATVSNAASGAKVNRAIVASPDDVGSPTSVPTGGSDPHYAARTINVDSLGGIQIDKAVDKRVIEPLDALTFTITYANLDLVPRDDMETIDVLPFDGDGDQAGAVPGRSPSSASHGTISLRSVSVSDGELVRYTDADPAAVYALYDPSGASPGFDALPAGKVWCTAAQVAADDAGCPPSIAAATALRVTRTGALGAAQSRSFSYTIDTHGNRSGDVYANTAALRSSTLLLGTLSPTRDARVVASRIGDLVWEDRDADGVQDAGEPGVQGVTVILDGVDKHGRAIHVVTTTDADGRYRFTGSTQTEQDAGVLDLDSGTYHVTFDPSTLPAGAAFTSRDAGDDDAADSDADTTTGRSGDIMLPDPSPSGTDGEDLTLDAGIVITLPPPPDPPTQPVSPPADQPPAAQSPAARPASQPAATAPRLRLALTASRARVRPGQSIRYTLTVRNTGRGSARQVQLCDVLPDHLTLASTRRAITRAGGTIRAGRLCWTIASLRAGAKAVRTFVVRVDADTRPGAIVNRATADSRSVRGVDTRAQRSVRVTRSPRQEIASRVTG